MVKKKRGAPGDCVDTSDESAPPACNHIKKAVNMNSLQRVIGSEGFARQCAKCKDLKLENDEEGSALWMCLACGAQLCGRSGHGHALEHFEKPHSDSHALVAKPPYFSVYCYACNEDVPHEVNRKLQDCVEYLRKRALGDSDRAGASGSGPSREPSRELSPTSSARRPPPAPPAAPGALTRVRGLTNLGNTCFFNSVVQCLARTPYLVDVLKETSVAGEKFHLPGGKMKLELRREKNEEEEEEDKDDDGDEKEQESAEPTDREVEVPPISGELSHWGSFTETLTNTLGELQTPGRGDVFTPKQLLQQFVTKVPQFAGGDQHDSHELLRHLLEAVRSEDLRRYQTVVLHKLGLDSKERRNSIDDEVKQKVKFYGQQASDSMLRPGQVFRGVLVSTLECQDCKHSSHTTEHFLDLSLPVSADKPQPPAMQRRKTQEEQIHCLGAPENEKSKHQLKKEAQAARKLKKSKKGGNQGPLIKLDDSNQSGENVDNKLENKSSSEQSDADVEDNVDDNFKTQGNNYIQQRDNTTSNYFMESGYNSEKVISSDSIRASPVDLENKEKCDVSPERTDKDTSYEKYDKTIIALPYKSINAAESPQPSNPDSGVASPETAKHALSDTANVESPITSKELCSPTSLSSEINMDMSSPRQSNNSPVCAEIERPPSRVAFNNEITKKLEQESLNCEKNKENQFENYDTKVVNIDADLGKLKFCENQFGQDKKKSSYINSYDKSENTDNASRNLILNIAENSDKFNNSYELNGPSSLTSPDIDSSKWKNDASEFSHNSNSFISQQGNQVEESEYQNNDYDSQKWKKDIPITNRSYNAPPRCQSEEGEYSIQSCLNQFTCSELLTGNNKVGCEACTKRLNTGKTVYTNATKRFRIESPPAVLILHLKRFQLGPRCMLRKISKHVNFPVILDVAPFCSENGKNVPNISANQNKILYSLYGVVEHSGSMHLGHYVAYVKLRSEVKPGDSRWKFLPLKSKTVPDESGSAKSPDLVNGAGNTNDNDTDSSLSGYESGEGAVGGLEVEPPPGKWYYISDSRVSETTEDKVLKVPAYLLFYERIL